MMVLYRSFRQHPFTWWHFKTTTSSSIEALESSDLAKLPHLAHHAAYRAECHRAPSRGLVMRVVRQVEHQRRSASFGRIDIISASLRSKGFPVIFVRVHAILERLAIRSAATGGRVELACECVGPAILRNMSASGGDENCARVIGLVFLFELSDIVAESLTLGIWRLDGRSSGW